MWRIFWALQPPSKTKAMCQVLLWAFYSALSQTWPHKQAIAVPLEESLILGFQPPTVPCSQFWHSEALCWENEMPACTSDIMFLIIGFMPHLL